MRMTWGWILYFGLAVSAHAAESPRVKCHRLLDQAPNPLRAIVERNVDGDTVHARIPGGSLGVRFLTIDTPETNFQGRTQGVWGDRASEFLEKVLPPRSAIYLAFEGERCDANGRALAYVYHGRTMINRLILENALAVNYCIAPNASFCVEFGKIVQKNIQARRGLFGSRTQVPYLWRKEVTGAAWDKYVGSLKTMLVYEKTEMKKVPIGERIFFFRQADVRPPFRWAE